jgi:hypothetical protein
MSINLRSTLFHDLNHKTINFKTLATQSNLDVGHLVGRCFTDQIHIWHIKDSIQDSKKYSNDKYLLCVKQKDFQKQHLLGLLHKYNGHPITGQSNISMI